MINKNSININVLMFLIVVSLFSRLVLGPAHSADDGSLIKRIKDIEDANTEKSGWIDGRGMEDYTKRFDFKKRGLQAQEESVTLSHFLNRFRNSSILSKKKTWFDMGAGSALAMREFWEEETGGCFGRNYNLIGLSNELPSSAVDILQKLDKDSSSSFNYLIGDINNFRKSKYFKKNKGKVDLITDVMGAFAYVENPGPILQTYLDLLTVGGRIYLNCQPAKPPGYDPQAHKEVNLMEHHITQIKKQGDNLDPLVDSGLSLYEWISKIPGLRVINKSDNPNQEAIIVIEKTDSRVRVPELQLPSPDQYKFGMPPSRILVAP